MLTVAPSCEFQVERGPDWLLVCIKNLDSRDSHIPLADRLWDLMQQHFTHRLVLELNDVEVLSSHLIEELMTLYRRIEEHDGVLRLCGLSPENREVLHVCHLDERLLPYGDRHEAVMGRPHFLHPR
jgi:anti-anti-sigma factor